LYIGGGFCANKLFRQQLTMIKKNVYICEAKYTSDNAAMIGYYAYLIKTKNH
jgi:tRNA A37 threonylcarbamoyltransferase TsaD